MSFADLKKNRDNQFEHIANKFKETNSPNKEYQNDDDRLWYPDADESGSGSAVIRFLPPTDNAPNGLPYVLQFVHAFQGPTGSWYIENCPTSIGKSCPVCDANRLLWNSGIEADKAVVRNRKRKAHYYSNVYIVKDPANPSNEGQIKIYRYGKVIFDMLNALMNPEFDDIDPVNPFDLWEGANLRLRFKKVDGYRKYNASTWDSSKPLDKDDKKLETIYNSMFDLNEFSDPDSFKPHDQLEERFKLVTEGKFNDRREEVEDSEMEEGVEEVETVNESAVEVDSSDKDEFDKLFEDLKD